MTYPGGKNGSGVYQQIINRIPPHDVYIEAFLGAGAIMRMKRAAAISIGIDIDASVIKAFSQGTTPNLTLHTCDAIGYLKTRNFTPATLIYCDPPYLMETRSTQRKLYRHELSDQDHSRLLTYLLKLECMVMISGYPNAMYDEALGNWHTTTFKTTNRRGTHVTEKLWMNYPPPVLLHDYSYLGKNFRDRERLKRKRLRWIARLGKMAPVERNCLAAAIAAFVDNGQHHQDERAAPASTAEKGAA